MPDAPDPPVAAGEQREQREQRELLARLRAAGCGLRAVAEAEDAGNTMLRGELAAAPERERRLELRIAELERRLGVDSANSGTPASKEPTGAKERRGAERKKRPSPERGAAQGPQARHPARPLREGPGAEPGP